VKIVSSQVKSFKEATREEYLASGHSACQGCGITIAARWIVKGLGKDTIVVNATGCMEIIATIYPHTAWRLPWIHVAFENAAATASGVEVALKVLMRKGKIPQRNVNVLALAGDGGTADIGLQALSGALERGHRFVYVCYDNEAYMNTGVQRSGLTPYDARTSTSPPGSCSWGNQHQKKNLLEICAAHHIPYAATATVGYPADLTSKVKKALKIKGPKFLHVHVPCPLGWIYKSELTIEIAKIAVLTGLFPIVEMEYNKVTRVRKITKERRPVEDYLKLQGRFKHLLSEAGKDELEKIRQIAEANIAKFGLV